MLPNGLHRIYFTISVHHRSRGKKTLRWLSIHVVLTPAEKYSKHTFKKPFSLDYGWVGDPSAAAIDSTVAAFCITMCFFFKTSLSWELHHSPKRIYLDFWYCLVLSNPRQAYLEVSYIDYHGIFSSLGWSFKT